MKCNLLNFSILKKNINRNDICHKYLSGKSINKIAIEENTTAVTVSRILKKNGIKIRYVGGLIPKGHKTNFTEQDIIEMIDLYLVHKKSVSEILKIKKSKTSPSQIIKIFRSNGVEIRSNSKQNTIYKINESYFDKIKKNQAYILGWLYTDGCIRLVPKKSFRVELNKIDKSILDFIKMELNSDAPLAKTSKNSIVFNSCNNKICDDLIKIGLSPNKSKTIKFPFIEEKYIPYFILGCIEGDGSVYITKRKAIGLSFTSGSKDFIESILFYLNKVTGKNRKIKTTKLNNYFFNFNSNEDIFNIFNYLYNDVDFCLPRKFLKFIEIFNLREKSPRWSDSLKELTKQKIDIISAKLYNELSKYEKETNPNPY